MIQSPVHSFKAVTLLGAGDVCPQILADALALAPLLVAADGGANVAVSAGLLPECVIGDLDSVSSEARDAIPANRFWFVSEQETTDFEKCLTRIEAPVILGLGFTGARIDHLLAVFAVLLRYPDKRCVIVDSDDAIFLAPRRITLDLAPGTRVSLFPMGAVRGESTGLRWPIDGLAFAPDGRIGTSNEAMGQVGLEFDAARMLIILPRECLTAALAGLERSPAWQAGSPAPARVPGG